MLLTRRQDSSDAKSNEYIGSNSGVIAAAASPTSLSTSSALDNRMSLRVYGNNADSLSSLQQLQPPAAGVTPRASPSAKDRSSPINPDLGYHTLVSATSPTPTDQWQTEISSPASWEVIARPQPHRPHHHHTHHHHHHNHQQQQQQQQQRLNLYGSASGTASPSARNLNHISSSSSDASSSRIKASRPKCSPFDGLPDDVVLKVFSYLSTNELCACSRVCRRFYFLTWEPGLWTNVELRGLQTDVDRALRSVVQLLCRSSPVTAGVCSTIERVVLSGCVRLTDRGLLTIARHCPEVRRLEIKGCHRVTNGGLLEVVSGCANLEHLDVTGCTQVDCIDMSRLRSRPHVDASGRPSQCGVETHIRYLDLTDCHAFDDQSLKATLRGCQQLTHLYMRRCAAVSDAGLRHVAAHCPFLRELSVSDCPQVTDFGLYELARRLGPSLRYLSVAKCDQVSDAGVKQLARHCYRLRYVNVRGCEAVSDDGAAALARSCPRLRSLDLGKCDVTDVGLRHLAENCPNLRRVSLKSCELVTDKGVRWLAVYCRGLQQLNVQDCRLVSVNGYRTVKRHCRRCIIEHTNPGFT